MALAMGRMNKLKKEQIEKQVNEEHLKDSTKDKDETKLEIVFKDDDIIKDVYQAVYGDIKASSEKDSKALEAIHD